MLVNLDLLRRKYPLNITGVLHVGAHVAEEADDYARHELRPVYWVEADPDLIPTIQANVSQYPDNHVIQACISDEDDTERMFNVTNNERGMSSSLLPLGTHAAVAPQVEYIDAKVLRTTTIDTLVDRHNIRGVNWLGADIQGAEMLMLRGAGRFIEQVDYLFTEINVDELYVGCARLWEMDNWLTDRGFLRVETCMAENHVGWGDALWIRHPRQ